MYIYIYECISYILLVYEMKNVYKYICILLVFRYIFLAYTKNSVLAIRRTSLLCSLSIRCWGWFASYTEHFCPMNAFVHILSVVKLVHIFMWRSIVSKS